MQDLAATAIVGRSTQRRPSPRIRIANLFSVKSITYPWLAEVQRLSTRRKRKLGSIRPCYAPGIPHGCQNSESNILCARLAVSGVILGCRDTWARLLFCANGRHSHWSLSWDYLKSITTPPIYSELFIPTRRRNRSTCHVLPSSHTSRFPQQWDDLGLQSSRNI